MRPARAPLRYTCYVGIDIAAKTATAARTTDGLFHTRPFTFAQNTDGYTMLHDHLDSTQYRRETMLVVMEATGPYWINLALFLVNLGYAVSIINPAQAHAFGYPEGVKLWCAVRKRTQSMPKRSPNSPCVCSPSAGHRPQPFTRSCSSA